MSTDDIYKQAVKEIESKAQSAGEKIVNKLFLDLGLDFIDCNVKVERNSQHVGEIDGLFKVKNDYLLILEIDDTKRPSSKKIGEFYSKWADKENIAIILNQCRIAREIEVVRVFVSYGSETPTEGIKESLKHHLNNPNNHILYKDDIEYFKKSFLIIGKWAKNDLINFIGLHKKSGVASTKKTALKVFVGKHKAYLFSATAYELLESCYIYRRRDKVQQGYQRILKESRIAEIKRTIEEGRDITFPNSFIISSDSILEEGGDERTGPCSINFPTDYCSCRMVDGQHRLLGFAKTEEKTQRDHNLPVVAFDDLDSIDEVKTFIAINTKQKNIDPNLLLILKSDFDWPRETKFFNEKQVVLVIKMLSETRSSPLYKKVFLSYNIPRSGKITLATLVSGILGNNLIAGKRHLLQKGIDDLDTPYKEISKIFSEMQRNLPQYCDLKRINQIEGFFFSNKGLRIIFRLIQLLIRNRGNVQIEYGELFNDLNKVISDKFVKDLQKYYGEGGAAKATEELVKKLKNGSREKYKKFKLDFKGI